MSERQPNCPCKPTIWCSCGPIEGSCCEVTPRDRPLAFSVFRRNPGHWDITTKWGRAFRIRGVPGDVHVSDERKTADGKYPPGWLHFDTVNGALAFCAAQLMHEDIPDVG